MNKCDILNQELLTNNGFVYRKRGWYRCTEDFLQNNLIGVINTI